MIQKDRDFNDLPTSSAASLMEYVYLFWQWAWLIALAGVLAGGAAYIKSSQTTPTYLTSTRLFISVPMTNNIDSTGLFNAYSMTTTYSQMMTDYPVLKGVMDRLGLNIDPVKLRKAISVSEIPNTQLVTVEVAGTDPRLIVDIANTLSAVFAERMSALQSERYTASKQALKIQVDDMEKQVQSTSTELAQTTDPILKQDVETRLTQYRQLYASLLTSYEQVRLAEAQSTTNVTVTDPARVVTQTGPKTLLYTLLAVAVGMILAGGAVFAMDALDDTIKNPEEIRLKFNLPILGLIALYKAPEGHTIVQYEPRSPVTESFRNLRTNITYASVDRPLRRIVITSPTPQDGKTTVATNLGIVLAQGGKTVALVDADMRRPQIHKRFGLSNRQGLSDIFVHPLEEFGRFTQTNEIPGLTIITSGILPPNPAELLTSHKMTEILDRLNQDNDLILLDCPPILSVTDASALAAGVDGVIVVVRPGETKLAALAQTLEQLQRVGGRVLGVVLNGIEPRSRKYGYYYSQNHSKYGYYYSADGRKVRKSRQEAFQVTKFTKPILTTIIDRIKAKPAHAAVTTPKNEPDDRNYHNPP